MKMRDRIRQMPREVWMALSLVVMTASAYFYVFHCDFVAYDDQAYVMGNKMVTAGLTWKGLLYAFTHTTLSIYTPLTLLSHMLDCQLFGTNPGGAHAMSLFYHLLSTVLVFWVLDKMTHEPWPSWAVAALFGLHPMHVEAVAWIAERKELLSTLFGLLALLAYAFYAESRSRRAYWAVFVCLLLSLLAKPMLVTLPFLLLLLDVWPLGRLSLFEPWPPREDGKTPPWPNRLKPGWLKEMWPLLREKIPLFLLIVMFSVATYLTNVFGGTLPGTKAFPMGLRLETGLYAYGQYIVKLFLPVGLSFFYPVTHLGLTMRGVLLPLLLLVAVTLFALRWAHRAPFLLVGWLWFLGTLVPVIGLIHVGSAQAYADRYTYFTYTGLFIVLVWAVYGWVKGRGLGARLTLYLFCGMLIVLGLQTASQVMVWRDSESLFTHSLQVAPEGNYVAMGGLGRIYYNKYRNIRGAKELLKKAISLGPVYPNWYNMGSILVSEGEYKEGEACLRQALAASRWGDQRASALSALAFTCTREGRFHEALAFAKRALAIDPDQEKAIQCEAEALLGLGRCREAEQVARAGLEKYPKNTSLSVQMAVALLGEGRASEGAPYMKRAMEERRGNPAVLFLTATDLLSIPEPAPAVREEALHVAQKAVQVTRGGQPWCLFVLGRALALNGRKEEARKVLGDCVATAKAKDIKGLERTAGQALADLDGGGAGKH